MGPAEIVASLKELCAAQGPRLTTQAIVNWIDEMGGFESNFELIQYAKKMKARQYARALEFDDPETNLKIKRLWSFYDAEKRQHYYADILDRPEDERRDLIQRYSAYLKQIKAVRRAMTDYFRGQKFFDFYPGDPDENESHTCYVPRLPGLN